MTRRRPSTRVPIAHHGRSLLGTLAVGGSIGASLGVAGGGHFWVTDAMVGALGALALGLLARAAWTWVRMPRVVREDAVEADAG